VTELRSEIPADLGRIIRHCLQKDPESRYQTAKGLRNELRELMRDTTSEAAAVLPAVETPRPFRSSKALWSALVVAGVIAIAIGVYVTTRPSVSPKPHVEKIVVLPFENLGPPEDAYFAAGMSDEITSRLAAVSGLGVISRTSAVQYDRTGKTISEIGRDLGVDYVLEGTVRWNRDAAGHGRVRFTPQLIRVSDDTHLWSERYDRILDDVFEVQSEIATTIVARLDVALSKRERDIIEARPTENLEAYQAYLRGVDYLAAPDWTAVDGELAIQLLERAVELDPEFALAHARLSEAQSVYYWFGYDLDDRRITLAREAATRAMELAPELARGHVAVGYCRYYGDLDYEGALGAFERAEKALPGASDVLAASGLVLRRLGRWEESVTKLEDAIELNPLGALAPLQVAETYRYLRRYAEADRHYDRSIQLSPDQTTAYIDRAGNYWRWTGDTSASRRVLETIPEQDNPEVIARWFFQEAYERNWSAALNRLSSAPEFVAGPTLTAGGGPRAWLEGLAHLWMGQPERARVGFQEALPHFEEQVSQEHQNRLVEAWFRSSLGMVYAALGREEDAIREGGRAMELVPVERDAREGTIFMGHMAVTYTRLGEPDLALDLIERMLSIPSDFSVPFLELDPEWDPLREHPRYRAILEKYG
jgi:serine/threonine-protein kinase